MTAARAAAAAIETRVPAVHGVTIVAPEVAAEIEIRVPAVRGAMTATGASALRPSERVHPAARSYRASAHRHFPRTSTYGICPVVFELSCGACHQRRLRSLAAIS